MAQTIDNWIDKFNAFASIASHVPTASVWQDKNTKEILDAMKEKAETSKELRTQLPKSSDKEIAELERWLKFVGEYLRGKKILAMIPYKTLTNVAVQKVFLADCTIKVEIKYEVYSSHTIAPVKVLKAFLDWEKFLIKEIDGVEQNEKPFDYLLTLTRFYNLTEGEEK